MAGIYGGRDVSEAAQAKHGADGGTGGKPAEPAEGSVSFVGGESLRCSHEGMLTAGVLQIGYIAGYFPLWGLTASPGAGRCDNRGMFASPLRQGSSDRDATESGRSSAGP